MEKFAFLCAYVAFLSLVVTEVRGEIGELRTRAANSTTVGTRRQLNGCGSGNPIDECWQCDPNWEEDREKLANCAIGYGENTVGGRNGALYVVSDSDDTPSDPKPGTLRYGVMQNEALWIVFDHDMHIVLETEFQLTSYKTIDGRGAHVHISKACITIQEVEHVIIHGLHIHDCTPTGPTEDRTDGDGIIVSSSTNIWIDHNYIYSCADGLLDVNRGSYSVSITNNIFHNHDKVMLLGSDDKHLEDRSMRVTVALNVFGPGLVQRMPRCRLGTFHVANNYYKAWEMYGIGGSANATISSEGNYFEAGDQKPVTKNMDGTGNWRSVGDHFVNGAWFESVGASPSSSVYANTNSFTALPASEVPELTANAGPTT